MKIQVMLLSLVWVALLLGENRPSVVGELDAVKMLKSEGLDGEPKTYYQKVIHNYNP